MVLCFLFTISCSSPSNPDGGSITPTEEELLVEKYGIDISQEDSVISQQIEKNLKDYFTEKGSYRVIFTGTPKDYTLKVNESLYKLTLEAAVKVNSTMNIDMDIKNIDFQNETINKWMFSGYVVDGTENIFINIIFPQNKIKTIGNFAFTDLYNTKEIVIPNSVINIGSYAFQQANKLEKLTLSKNLETIGKSAFVYAQSLKELVIPDSVISIEEGAFANGSLQKLQLSSSLETIGPRAFTYLQIEELTIPASVKTIGDKVFAFSFTALKSVVYLGTTPDDITSKGTGIFEGCNNLTTLKVPNAPETTTEALKSKWQNFLGSNFTDVRKK